MQQIVVNTTAKSDDFSGDYGNGANVAANSTTQVTDIAGEFCITDNEKEDTLRKESQDEYNTGFTLSAV